jgi:hypothetical protein
MRPVPIPPEAVWKGGVRRVFSAPDGDLLNPDIAPVEAVVDQAFDGTPRVSVRCMLEDGDLGKLAAGGHVWISFYGGLPPFSVDVTDGGGA